MEQKLKLNTLSVALFRDKCPEKRPVIVASGLYLGHIYEVNSRLIKQHTSLLVPSKWLMLADIRIDDSFNTSMLVPWSG